MEERSRKFSQFMKFPSGVSPSNISSDFLPTILNNQTESTLTTLQSFRYDRASPVIDISQVVNTSSVAQMLEEKRRRGNYSHVDIFSSK